MYNAKKIVCAASALALSFSAAACSSGSKDSSSVYKEKVKIEDTDTIAPIPEGAETELEWLSYFDINPSKNSQEKRVDLSLFEKKGGSIKYSATSSMTKYDQLANRLLSNDPPDLFWFEQKMTFPCYCIKGMFQPVDEIVDFDQSLWSEVKPIADEFVLKGEHYVCPIETGSLITLTYNKDFIEANALSDPYDLYMEGNWTWNEWYDLMDEYCSGAQGEESRYGINGWFAPFVFHSTGKTLINYDAEKDEYVSNIDDPDFDRASDLLYDIQKNNLYYQDWIGSATDAFKKNILFYAMGTWAVTPKEGDNWGMVPMPRDPNTDEYYTSLSITAYMWVKGSQKSDAVKCWYECARTAATDPVYKEQGKEKLFVSQPYWTEEMYDMSCVEPTTEKYNKIVDPGYGISTLLSNDDAANTPTKEAVIAYMYSSVMKSDDDGVQFTWAKLRETYRSTIDSELKDFNEEYHKFINQ